ncbi:hypothetical protein cyc_07158 [Cyclospora cayetanensis]|uniref:Uncharacterized protein n=1 Tax=Cyclospora cayetanensis TaxID=88456 RepID=A0A1D3D5M2_9EIME|nr:hypothetical protein cyc_07158 [Cyclospora cayetanensis]
MDAAGGGPPAGSSGGPLPSPRTGGEAISPSLRPSAPSTPSMASPAKLSHALPGTEGAQPSRKEKLGTMKRRRDGMSRPLLVDRSGAMPRPPPDFDFASDSDFLTGRAGLNLKQTKAQVAFVFILFRLILPSCVSRRAEGKDFKEGDQNEEDREEEALAMNAALLAECSDRNARGAHGAEDTKAAPEDDAEALLKQRRRQIVANCFMGVTSTADALVLLSRRLTYAVKIPGISFHKGVESWLCTWKEPDSRQACEELLLPCCVAAYRAL